MPTRILRIVFFGTADFAVPSLEALLEAGHEVLAVVTQPDKPQGRGQQLAASPVKKVALQHGLPVMQPRRVRAESFLAKMRDLAPDALTLAAFGQIIPQALLDLPPLGPINVHGSLLPAYRGAAPIQRAIINGEAETGVTTMWMEATLDTGDMLLKKAIPIEVNDTSGSLFAKLAPLGAQLLLQTLDGLAAGTLSRQPQDEALATLAPMITPEDSVLRWEETAWQIGNRIRGLSPRPGVYATLNGKRFKVWEAIPLDGERSEQAPGTLLDVKSMGGPLVAAGEQTVLRLVEVQPDSGKRMSAADWIRGLRLQVGERFG